MSVETSIAVGVVVLVVGLVVGYVSGRAEGVEEGQVTERAAQAKRDQLRGQKAAATRRYNKALPVKVDP